MKTPLHKAKVSVMLSQAGKILLLAAAMGLVVNQFRSESLFLWFQGNPAQEVTFDSQKIPIIPLKEAELAFLSRNALFLDARPAAVYQQGHISGARNLPVESFEQDFDRVMADVARDAMIITYCDGEIFSLSKDLAMRLVARGFQNVRVFVKGWIMWTVEELPIEGGLRSDLNRTKKAGDYAS